MFIFGISNFFPKKWNGRDYGREMIQNVEEKFYQVKWVTLSKLFLSIDLLKKLIVLWNLLCVLIFLRKTML